MNEKQQQLTFEKGITNVPSDALCSDNTLEESVGMIYDNGEHRVIQRPIEKVTGVSGKILYIHKFNNKRRYIHIVGNDTTPITYTIYFSEDGINTIPLKDMAGAGLTFKDNKVTVTSIGKTLILNHEGEQMQYFLWEDETGNEPTYLAIGALPDPTVKFWLESGMNDFLPGPDPVDIESKDKFEHYVYNSGAYDGIIADNYMGQEGKPICIDRGAQDKYDDLTIGLYSKNLKSVAQKKGFCQPFFARYAIEMYDGTYTHISNPVLLMPCVTRNSFSILYEQQILTTFTKYCSLHYSVVSNGLDKFSDVIKDIVIFISDGVDPYDTTVSQPFSEWDVDWNNPRQIDEHETVWPLKEFKLVSDGIYMSSGSQYSLYHEDTTEYAAYRMFRFTSNPIDWIKFDTLKQKEQSEIVKGLQGASIFYKLCELGLNDSNGDIAEKIDTHTLENLTTQEQLEVDDYFSRSSLLPGFMYAYNSRLNIANVSRGFFEGFKHFIAFDEESSLPRRVYDITVRIKGDTRNYYVKTSRFITAEQMGIYFYYPDSRADYVWIRKFDYNADDSPWHYILCEKLEEHSGLNGAYYFKVLPGIDGHGEPVGPASGEYRPDNIDNNSVEILPNYIITSEVNNPWVFGADGYNKVGVGRILGMSTTTMALSQDQFGRTDLMVFSDNGIWGMQVNSTGLFQSIHPFSREVCNNPDSITQTDGAVFFTSEKGLMMAWDSGVKCVSEQLSGRESDFDGEIIMGNLRDYMKECFIAYDYRDSLLWIFNKNRVVNNNYCYVYSIKTSTFGKYEFEIPIENVVNDYPDYLLQTGGILLSLTGRMNINLDDEDDYSGLLITRPMKLENGLALKSLMQIRHIKQMQGSMTMRIFASNNLDHWVELHSLRGTPWKYYRFRFDFADMMATDRFAGTLVVTQERRTNKLR